MAGSSVNLLAVRAVRNNRFCDPVGLLLAVAERLQAHLDATARAVGITHAQAKLLMQLYQPMRLGDLASQKDCDPSSITALVQRLERDVSKLRDMGWKQKASA